MTSPLIAVPAYPMAAGRVDGWADPAVAIQAMYLESLQRAGAQDAVLAPRSLDPSEARAMLERFDGLLLAGGGDVIPDRYGQPPEVETYGQVSVRDEFEFALCDAAIELGLPLLAICRGAQVLNVSRGGSLHQHITEDFPGHGKPGVEGAQNVHAISIDASSRIGEAMGVPRANCSCHHHQSIDVIGHGLRVTARADDGIVEAIELDGPGWVTGVQWHPEDTAAVDPIQQGLFDSFVRAVHQ